jgi:hypothetical protein
MIPQSFKIEKIKEAVTHTKPYKRELNASEKGDQSSLSIQK